eukprot:TRINITY_DN58782_c0_g1_i1.p1 TRINITY_DN58782_c0_g1~~TRINITY_DN58782_c0_g1_i1.p1  ORF type:complete len:315 (-),score=24.53 TRINITY_DN58782_c0_g1_i1:146-1066(-)
MAMPSYDLECFDRCGPDVVRLLRWMLAATSEQRPTSLASLRNLSRLLSVMRNEYSADGASSADSAEDSQVARVDQGALHRRPMPPQQRSWCLSASVESGHENGEVAGLCEDHLLETESAGGHDQRQCASSSHDASTDACAAVSSQSHFNGYRQKLGLRDNNAVATSTVNEALPCSSNVSASSTLRESTSAVSSRVSRLVNLFRRGRQSQRQDDHLRDEPEHATRGSQSGMPLHSQSDSSAGHSCPSRSVLTPVPPTSSSSASSASRDGSRGGSTIASRIRKTLRASEATPHFDPVAIDELNLESFN